MEVSEDALGRFFSAMFPVLDERQRRLAAGATARMLGRGGITRVAEASGMSRNTVIVGTREIDRGAGYSDRVRRLGAGSRPRIELHRDLLTDLDALVDPDPLRDAMSPLRWTLKSTHGVTDALVGMGHRVSPMTVYRLLDELGYSMRAPSGAVDDAEHADRDLQFARVNDTAKTFLAASEPVISVDCKRRQLIGKASDRRNAERAWEPEYAGVHEVADPDMLAATDGGVPGVGADEGWMRTSRDHDTSTFAVNAILRWWQTMGSKRYRRAKRLLVTAYAGGSNGYRNRRWKVELARLAADIGLDITVCHYPPGTSKWNTIVLYTGFPGVYEVTNEPAPSAVSLARNALSASRR